MQSLIHMAGGIALLLWGAYMVKTGMLRTFGVALKDFLSVRLKNRAKVRDLLLPKLLAGQIDLSYLEGAIQNA